MMRKTREVAIFIYRGSEFLLAHRVPQGVWNVIAGQVEDDESYAAAAARELEEETGLVATPVDLDLTQRYTIEPEYRALYAPDDTTVEIRSFAVAAPASWEPTLNHEHDIYRWCSLDEAIALAHWPEMKAGFRAAATRLGMIAAG
jgi:8-oxo-dGTP pyrophosphatase MutT (NUDIX family)